MGGAMGKKPVGEEWRCGRKKHCRGEDEKAKEVEWGGLH